MARYLVRRVLGALVILLVVTAVTYFLFFTAPSDPARLSCGSVCTPASYLQIKHNMGLDQPVYQQLWQYLSGIVAGRDIGSSHCDAPCLGYSFYNHKPVFDTLSGRFPATLSLVCGAVLVFLALGVGAGLIAAARRGSATDKAVSVFALVGAAVQIYFIGILARYFFVDRLRWLPQPGYQPFTDGLGDWFGGMVLAWLVLAVVYTASYSRYTRSSMIDALNDDAVRTARAKGLPGSTVFFKYAGRAALTPVVTIFGLDLGHLLGGAMITETTFNIAGIGQTAVQAVEHQDLPTLVGVTLIAAFFMVLFGLIVDLVYGLIDPRVRLS
ncbi:ABC transporter permease [Streptomyces sp. NBC_00988]|uniref:ABC transporter permease n=1 Tax=Streptomyces sp. NBC_00988 TaxID=2903704 RepID=UPI00386FB7C8|nr:ABC transporter permease [Streptomyces sp. NBC_00988]